MKTKSDTVKNVCKVVMLPVFVYLLFFICSGGAFGKPASLIMNLKQTLAPTLISFAMCSNMLCNRMDLSAGAVVMLSAMFGAKMVYLYGIGLIPFALIVVGAGIVLGTISGVMYMLLRVPAIVTALGVCMVYETLSNLASISWVTFLASMSNTELLEICQKWAQKKQQIFFGFTASCAAAGRRDIQFLCYRSSRNLNRLSISFVLM